MIMSFCSTFDNNVVLESKADGTIVKIYGVYLSFFDKNILFDVQCEIY